MMCVTQGFKHTFLNIKVSFTWYLSS